MRRPVFFDLDGTLIDSSAIISRSLNQTMCEQRGINRGSTYYRQFIGPPLPYSFRKLGIQEEEIPHFVHAYREKYLEMMFDSPLFDGVPDLLETLHQVNVPLAVATSKPINAALSILDKKGIRKYFTAICGADPLEEESTKASIVGEAIDVLTSRGIPVSGGLMVGDRIYDIEGAGSHGLATVLVRWGEGTPSEFDKAWKCVDTMRELGEVLLRWSDDSLAPAHPRI